MSGHSHWATIKHKKGATDAKRGLLYSKLAKQIMVAARNGSDPDMNLRLKYAIEKARAANMTRDSIDRAVKKGAGELAGQVFEEILYEGYASGGVAIMLAILTDNRNRTAGEIRKIFETRGGALGTSGSVAYLFDRKGLILAPTGGLDEDRLTEIALDAGADDIRVEGDECRFFTAPEELDTVKKALVARKVDVKSAEGTWIAKTTIPLERSTARRVLDLLDELDNNEDVQESFSNYEISDEVLAEIEAEAAKEK